MLKEQTALRKRNGNNVFNDSRIFLIKLQVRRNLKKSHNKTIFTMEYLHFQNVHFFLQNK